MKHKTSELTGALLDAAVGKALGLPTRIAFGGCIVDLTDDPLLGPGFSPYEPSKHWVAAGRIIEREWIELSVIGPSWLACARPPRADGQYVALVENEHFGPTPLIAAMRCFVASKLGEEVELP